MSCVDSGLMLLFNTIKLPYNQLTMFVHYFISNDTNFQTWMDRNLHSTLTLIFYSLKSIFSKFEKTDAADKSSSA